jgi:hypothetical protein
MVEPLSKKHISLCIQPHEGKFSIISYQHTVYQGNKLQHHQQKTIQASYPKIIIVNLCNKPYVCK